MADCVRCGGACCESVTLEVNGPNNDFLRFLELRSQPQMQPSGKLARNFECRCLMLKAGRCLIYEQRPKMCAAFEPGGNFCRTTVEARRSADEALAILGSSEAV